MGRYDEALAKGLSGESDFRALSDVFGGQFFQKAKVQIKTYWRRDPKTGKLVMIQQHERNQHELAVRYHQGHKIRVTDGLHAGKTGEIRGWDADKQNFRAKLDDGTYSAWKVHNIEHVDKNEYTVPEAFKKKSGEPVVSHEKKTKPIVLQESENSKHKEKITGESGQEPGKKKKLESSEKSSGEWKKQVIFGEHGSNPGGEYIGPDGGHYYVKFYHDPDQAKSEHFADEFTKEMGLLAPNTSLPTIGGKEAFASRWIEKTTLQKMGGPSALGNISAREKDEIAKLYLVACLTANWDVVGLGYDNLAKTKDGHWFCVDTGGTFKFRAQGGAKPFGPKAVEFESLLKPPSGYPYVGKVMEKILPDTLAKNPQKYVDWLTEKMNHSDFSKLLNTAKESGFEAKAARELIGNMFERRDDLIKRIAQKYGADLEGVQKK